jgi:hypothetical protein
MYLTDLLSMPIRWRFLKNHVEYSIFIFFWMRGLFVVLSTVSKTHQNIPASKMKI